MGYDCNQSTKILLEPIDISHIPYEGYYLQEGNILPEEWKQFAFNNDIKQLIKK